MIRYTVTVSNRTAIGQGWRVSAFGLPDDDWNALGRHVVPASKHRTREAAMKRARELAATFGADLIADEERAAAASLI